MNAHFLIGYVTIGILSFCFSNLSLSQSQDLRQIHGNVNSFNPESVVPNSPSYQGLIPGTWRGFHETEKFTVYYGYQFRADGTFWARHRIYEQQATIENKLWEGQWTFDEKILKLTGIKKDDPSESITIQLQLTNVFTLIYQQGSLSEVYQSMELNKIGSLK